MKRFVGLMAARLRGPAAALAFALAAFAAAGGAAAADGLAALENDQIAVAYFPPSSSFLRPIAQGLRDRKFLETMKQFLSPLKLPPGVKLQMTFKECGQVNSWWWGPTKTLFLCYEWFDYSLRSAPDGGLDGMTREDAAVGAFLQVTFHELGHAMFDIFDVPVLGREEDAADQMAGLILTQFGPDVARRTIPGTVYLWRSIAESEGAWGHDAFSDEHGNPLQRAYNYLCMAYGADPATFQYFVDSGLLPKARAEHCGREYKQIVHAFAATILPHVDLEKMKIVRNVTWLRPEGEEIGK